MSTVNVSSTPRLSVMQVVLSLAPGGTERLVIEITRSLAESVASVVCCLDEKGRWAAEVEANGIPVTALGREPGLQPVIGRRITELADRHAIDVLHCHHYTPFVYGQWAALHRRRLKVVFTEHGRLSDSPPSFKRRLVNPVLGRLPSAIFAVSDDLKRHMVAEGFPARHVSVLHNGIAPGDEPDAETRTSARRLLNLSAEALVFGTVARLDPVKDLVTLIESFAVVRRHAPGSQLVVVGDGPELAALQQRVKDAGVLDAVHFAGFSSEARSLMSAFDVYVNTSTHEGVSLTILEAMAAATPVVATAVGGTPEVVLDGQTGLLVPSRSPQPAADAMLTLARDPDLRLRFGQAGRVRVLQHFSLDAMTARYLRAYDTAARGTS